MSEIKPGEALGKIARYIVDLEADRDRASDACASVQRERDDLRDALRGIAEGNLGDAHWQANYDRIRVHAARALARYEAGK